MPSLSRFAVRAKAFFEDAFEWMACVPVARRLAQTDHALAMAIFHRDIDAMDAALAAGADPFAIDSTRSDYPMLFVAAAREWRIKEPEDYASVHRRLFAAVKASPLYAKRAPRLAWELLSAGPCGWMSAAALLRDGCAIAAPSVDALLEKILDLAGCGSATGRAIPGYRPDLEFLRAALDRCDSPDEGHETLRQALGQRGADSSGEFQLTWSVLLGDTRKTEWARQPNSAFADLLAARRLTVDQLRIVVDNFATQTSTAHSPGATAGIASARDLESVRMCMPLSCARIEHDELRQALVTACAKPAGNASRATSQSLAQDVRSRSARDAQAAHETEVDRAGAVANGEAIAVVAKPRARRL